MPMFDVPDIRDMLYKVVIVCGAIIVIYGVLWLLVSDYYGRISSDSPDNNRTVCHLHRCRPQKKLLLILI